MININFIATTCVLYAVKTGGCLKPTTMENRKPIYGIGDKVKIVKYGHPIWENKNVDEPKLSFPLIEENENVRWLDMSPDLVGQEGLVSKVSMTQGIPSYAIEGIEGKHAWYDEGQMEMINKNPNR